MSRRYYTGLFEHAGNIVSREELVDYLWENQIYIDDNTLSVNVRRLRDEAGLHRSARPDTDKKGDGV